MQLLNSPSAWLDLAKLAIDRQPHIRNMLRPTDYTTWERKLNEKNAWKYVMEIPAHNLLTASAISGLGLQQDLHDPATKQAQLFLAKLGLYLEHFPNLISDKSFHGKVCNLELFNFLGTINELSIAYYFCRIGMQVTFEQPFIKFSGNTKKDVDVTLTDAHGSQLHLEVYMPTDDTVIDGFFNPTEGNHHYAYKIGKKALDKFGDSGIGGLSGQVLLAVNSALLPLMQIQKVIGKTPISKLNNAIALTFPSALDGLLIFSDDFGSMNSFFIEEFFLKRN
jgi:hypothetical protein